MAVTSALTAVTSALTAVTSALTAVTSALTAVTSALMAVTSALMAVTSALTAVTSALTAVTSALTAVRDERGVAGTARPALEMGERPAAAEVVAPAAAAAAAAVGRQSATGGEGGRRGKARAASALTKMAPYRRVIECTAYCSCGYCCKWEWGLKLPGSFYVGVVPGWMPLRIKRRKKGWVDSPIPLFANLAGFEEVEGVGRRVLVSEGGEQAAGLVFGMACHVHRVASSCHVLSSYRFRFVLLSCLLLPCLVFLPFLAFLSYVLLFSSCHLLTCCLFSLCRVSARAWIHWQVDDKGSAIRGATRIDLYHYSHNEALHWGRRRVNVLVVPPGESVVDLLHVPKPFKFLLKGLNWARRLLVLLDYPHPILFLHAHPTTPILARVSVHSPLTATVLGTLSLRCSTMAGHGDALSDDEGGADLDGADADAIEEARTGLDLLLSSLGRHIQPPLPTPPDPDPPVPKTPVEPSSPDSIQAGTPASAGVCDTVLVGTSASKSSSPRKVKLKQQRVSFGKSSSSVPVSQPVVTESTVRPSLNINGQELVDAIYADALEKYKTKWVERFPWLVLTKMTRKHTMALEKQEALLAAATSQPRINEHRAAVGAEKIRVVSLLDVLLFVSQCNAPTGTWVKLVQYLVQKGV
ncbi:unnamed protein product [Closterium sp. NIES-54]